MGLNASEILVVCLLAMLLFGGGKIADIGRGLGEGIKNFKKGLREADVEPPKDEPAEKAKAKSLEQGTK